MFIYMASCCVGPQIWKDMDTGNVVDHKPRAIHKMAWGTDLLVAIGILVTGILSVTAPHLGITLPPAAQWACIGGGAFYVVTLFCGAISHLKDNSSYANRYLCGFNGMETRSCFERNMEYQIVHD